jgi:hypothetical protein
VPWGVGHEPCPAAQAGEPDGIAKLAHFLASDVASYMTGSIVVDGYRLVGDALAQPMPGRPHHVDRDPHDGARRESNTAYCV